MPHHPLIAPMLSLIGLTLVVWLYMYWCRIGYLLRHKIPAQRLQTPEQVNQLLPVEINAPSNNLKNLFEMPVLFYALCLLLISQNQLSAWQSLLAWLYVGLRVLHSLIHCTLNHVMLRFISYLLSNLLLLALFDHYVSALLGFN